MSGAAIEVDGHTLTLGNLDKVLYPATGTTKLDVIDYYTKVSVHLLDELAGRPVTRRRWPNGVDQLSFFEKNVSSGTPDWITRATLATPGSSRGVETLTFPVIDSLAALVWHANMAALELHTPQWTVSGATTSGEITEVHQPDRLVIDLDPGPGAGLAECAEVALLVLDRLGGDREAVRPVTSGSKGMQLYADLGGGADSDLVRDQVRTLAEGLAGDHPGLVTATMTKSQRVNRVFLDWSQNSASKTTITPWSLRGRDLPCVAAPRTWAEVEDAGTLTQLRYEEVLGRL
ncbi:MAG: non-homologous end-joining DNA ligase [Actinomycetales bacterium]